jgi:hypothetical protein
LVMVVGRFVLLALNPDIMPKRKIDSFAERNICAFEFEGLRLRRGMKIQPLKMR